MKKCINCNKVLPNYIKIDGKTKNISKRKYCLDCSPFKLHNTQKLYSNIKIIKGYKICPKCKKQKERKEFYDRKGKGVQSFCKKCFNDRIKSFWTKRRLDVIKDKGGKCSVCGYSKNPAALELHHKNPKDKKASWGKIKLMGKEKFKAEIKKCVLICANCHRELHNPLNLSSKQ